MPYRIRSAEMAEVRCDRLGGALVLGGSVCVMCVRGTESEQHMASFASDVVPNSKPPSSCFLH